MFRQQKLSILDDYFKELSVRTTREEVYFYRISGYTPQVAAFIRKYYEEARLRGVVIEGRIPNPAGQNLSYYEEMMGMDFQMAPGFIESRLQKWLPRMNPYQRKNMAMSMYDFFASMQRAGKTEGMLKNAYIKFMCWLYYKFERIVNLLGENSVPKILYEGDISHYELMLLSILCHAGCDIVLLQYHGDQNYQKLDAANAYSMPLTLPDMQAFPGDFSLKNLRMQQQQEIERSRLYGRLPDVRNCTNAWIEGKSLLDIAKPPTVRGSDPDFYYNCYCQINGVEDKTSYTNELYQLYQELKARKRNIVIVNGQIEPPTPEEIAKVSRKNYSKTDEMLLDLKRNLQYPANRELQSLMIKAFLDVLLEEEKALDENRNKLTNKAVYLICWMMRYLPELFKSWRMPQIGCFFYMGGCKNRFEALFLKMLGRLPVDVLILDPDRSATFALEDQLLYQMNFTETLHLQRFPQENTEVRMGTAAYHAERELDTLMYQDSGLYRNQQYQRADIINLQTMYEEIRLLWNEEVKYRPNFSTMESIVNIPVIFAKVSGVKDGKVSEYWSSIRELITEDTMVIKSFPYIQPLAANPIKPYVTEFYKNGRLQKAKIKNHPAYAYGFLREEIQEHILDKLQILIEQKLIRGTFENGTEYTILSTILNLPKEILRMLQKFDFTKKNPKLIYINPGEKVISLEDAILTAFLNLAGFDILFFIPTGYQNIENFYNRKRMEEHQIGEYLYDLNVPDLTRVPLPKARQKSWRDILFRRE